MIGHLTRYMHGCGMGADVWACSDNRMRANDETSHEDQWHV